MKTHQIALRLRNILAVLIVATTIAAITRELAAQTYSLPNNDAGCPTNCRQIPWLAGSDLWNGGTLPVYPVATTAPNAGGGSGCTGLTEGRQTSTDNTSAINACITTASAGQAVLIPAGIYYVNGVIAMKDQVVLRGAGGGPGCQGLWLNGADNTDTWDNPTNGYWGDTLSGSPAACTTTLYFGASGTIFSGFGGDIGTLLSLSGGYMKGSTALTSSTNPSTVGITANAWVYLGEQSDPAIPVSQNGSACTYCGLPFPNEGTYFMAQMAQVTSVTGTGPYTINLSRPLYYTFQSSLSPVAGKLTELHLHQGVENLRIAGVLGSNNARTSPMLNLGGWVEGWVKGVEIYNVSFHNNTFGIFCQYCYGNEFRDGYIHYGGGSGGNGSGANYCYGLFGANSDNKIENNICREDRHTLILEGGGSGDVYLYNYSDDLYDASIPGNTDTYINNVRGVHGAHPYMNLWEGNVGAIFHADYIHGSSSHNVLFRNWFWGDSTGNRFNWAADGAAGSLWDYTALEIDYDSHYYSAVGNVLGNTSLPGPYHAQWSLGTVLPPCNGAGRASSPVAYLIGCDENGVTSQNPGGVIDPLGRSTTILHGNYDYKTLGVAFWDGGSNHSLPNSMYPPYASGGKPAYFGSCPWPVVGPDLNPITNPIPAQERYLGLGCATQPPRITSPASDVGVDNMPYSYQIMATNSPSSFAASGLPASLSVNTGTGLISGTPLSTGTFNVALAATNAFGGSTPFNLALTIQFQSIVPPIVAITSPSNGAAASGNLVVQGTSSDVIGISSVAVSVDGGAFNAAAGTVSWSSNVNTFLLANGAHTLQARAWDPQHNTSTSTVVNISVNNTVQPDASVGLKTAIVYPNPVTPPYNPVIRVCPGIVDSISVTISDVSGRVVNSSEQFNGPIVPSQGAGAGNFCYEYTWTGRIASGVYFAVVHAHGSGTTVKARIKFAVVR